MSILTLYRKYRRDPTFLSGTEFGFARGPIEEEGRLDWIGHIATALLKTLALRTFLNLIERMPDAVLTALFVFFVSSR